MRDAQMFARIPGTMESYACAMIRKCVMFGPDIYRHVQFGAALVPMDCGGTKYSIFIILGAPF